MWVPRSPELLEVNFVGMDAAQDPAEAYVLDDDQLPLLVFGALSLVSPMTPSLERRVRQLRSRVAVRSWDYRQRRHARGVWFRLRRLLAGASAAYIIPLDEARTLLAEGVRPEPVGDQSEPPKLIVFVPAERIAQIASARPVPVRLGVDVLTAECIALTPFESDETREGRAR